MTLNDRVRNDEIDNEEAGFLRGYEDAAEEDMED